MPRLFIAINFPAEVTERLYSCAEYLRKNSIKANPSRKENLHLTLAFIGETSNIRGAVNAMKETLSSPFEITVEGYSQFSSRDGNICYAKVKDCETLRNLAENLKKNLLIKGFAIDTKPFKPHITLCRQFIPSSLFSEKTVRETISAQTFPVREICLMRSDRINGRLTYTQVHKKIL